MDTLDPQVVNLAKAIRQTESGGNFQAKGKSGEYGAYQFTQPTWDTYAKKHGVNASLDQATPEQQNEVAYKQIKEWKDSGYNVGQIASLWNSGKPDAYKDTSYKGVNKMGVSYDVPAYAKSVATAYQTIKNGGNVVADPNNPSSVDSTEQNKGYITTADLPTPTNEDTPDLKASNGTGVVGGALDVLGNLSGTQKLAQGLGYTLSNAMGGQQGILDTLKRNQDTQTELLQRIKENKAVGRDTSRLQKALADLTDNMKKESSQVSDIGTGGITDGQVLGSGAQTLGTILTAPSLIKGGIGLVTRGGVAPAVEEGIKRVGLNMTKYEALGNADKVEALTESIKRASPVNATVIQQEINKILPYAIKEAGGEVPFAQLYPKVAKVIGLGGGALKFLARAGMDVAGLGILNRLTK